MLKTCLSDGVAQIENGDYRLALEAFTQALILDPRDAAARYNAGVACHMLEDYAMAVSHYLEAIRSAPELGIAYHNLAQAYTKLNRTQAAIDAYRQALVLNPNDANSACNLGLLYDAAGNWELALEAFQQALQSKPDFAEAFSALGMAWCRQDRFEEAMVCLQQALAINPHLADAYLNMGIVFQKTGNYEQGLQYYRSALECDPACAPARWLNLLNLPMIYDSPISIDNYRRRFGENLHHLISTTALETKRHRKSALKGIRTTTNFFLQYQGRNDLAFQKAYGEFVHRVMSANYPQWTMSKDMPALPPQKKIRIGYVSSYMCAHTVGIFLWGWIQNHDVSQFQIHCYHVGRSQDTVTAHIRAKAHRFHAFGDHLEAAAGQIESDKLHILVHTDIGMNPITLQLAALRLAPIQCKGWGHPVTTGLPTVDYYLSSDLMELEDADRHYSETLVRLPNLALCVDPPKLPLAPKSRKELGIDTDRFIYLTSQSIFKYLPQHDDIYPRIAQAVPHASFVFLANQSQAATEKFFDRLRVAFDAYGLNADQYCRFSRRLVLEDFYSLNLAADVLLDTFDWSGGKTTLEAIGCGLPVITCPGSFMRGRHAYAMLRMMGVTSTIANDKSAYCRLAIRMATDQVFYAGVKNEFLTRRHKLFNDRSFIRALEEFYRSAVKSGLKPIPATTAEDRA